MGCARESVDEPARSFSEESGCATAHRVERVGVGEGDNVAWWSGVVEVGLDDLDRVSHEAILDGGFLETSPRSTTSTASPGADLAGRRRTRR